MGPSLKQFSVLLQKLTNQPASSCSVRNYIALPHMFKSSVNYVYSKKEQNLLVIFIDNSMPHFEVAPHRSSVNISDTQFLSNTLSQEFILISALLMLLLINLFVCFLILILYHLFMYVDFEFLPCEALCCFSPVTVPTMSLFRIRPDIILQ